MGRPHYEPCIGITGLRGVSQEQTPFMVPVAPAYRQFPPLAGEARSYAERLFVFKNTDNLSPSEQKSP